MHYFKKLPSIVGDLIILLSCVTVSCQQDREKIEVSTRFDGTRRVIQTINGVLDGRTLVLYPNGEIAAIFQYKSGKQEGPQRWFYTNGNVKRIQYARNNKPNGLSYEFYPQGHPDFVDSLVNGKRQGPYLEFFNIPPYRIHIRGRFKLVNGIEQLSTFTEYDTTGKVIKKL